MWQVLTTWTAFLTPGGTSVQYWDDEFDVIQVQQHWQDFLTSIRGILSPNTTWRIEPVSKQIQEATGELVGESVNPTTLTGVGNGAGGGSVANAAQGLLRWRTNTFIGGRALRGATNIPGLRDGAGANGEVSTATLTTVNSAIQAMDPANSGLGVWHRPHGETGGSFHRITGGTMWNEFAVLRRRR